MTKNKRFISKDKSIINVATDELVNASSEESAKILVDWLNKLNDENKLLKEFIKDLRTKGTNYIDLANGYSFYTKPILGDMK